MSPTAMMFDPDYESAIGLAKHLTSEELQQLLDDEDKLGSMIKDLQQIKNIAAEKDLLLASNKSLAEYNLSLQPALEIHRQELFHLYEKAGDLQSSVQVKKSELEGVKSENNTDTVLALLQTETAKVEEETESYVENLLSGEFAVDEFLEQYLKKRTYSHILRTKSEKMEALLVRNNFPAHPPEKPARVRRPPPPPPPVGQTPYPIPFSNTISPVPYNSRTSPVIIPTRHAPRPPVPTSQKGFNSPANQINYLPRMTVTTNGGRFPHTSQPVPQVNSSYVYPHLVKLPLPN